MTDQAGTSAGERRGTGTEEGGGDSLEESDQLIVLMEELLKVRYDIAIDIGSASHTTIDFLAFTSYEADLEKLRFRIWYGHQ